MAPATSLHLRLTEPIIYLTGGLEYERARRRRRVRAARNAQQQQPQAGNSTTSATGAGGGGGSESRSPSRGRSSGSRRPSFGASFGATLFGHEQQQRQPSPVAMTRGAGMMPLPRSPSRGRTPSARPPSVPRRGSSLDPSTSLEPQIPLVEPEGSAPALGEHPAQRTTPRAPLVTGHGTAEEAAAADEPPPAVLRALLTMTLAKPTRVKRIVVKLRGMARTDWPEGIGPRRLDVMEEHALISETVVLFEAKGGDHASSQQRRAASIGPGVGARDESRGPPPMPLSQRQSPDAAAASHTREIGDQDAARAGIEQEDEEEERGRGRQGRALTRGGGGAGERRAASAALPARNNSLGRSHGTESWARATTTTSATQQQAQRPALNTANSTLRYGTPEPPVDRPQAATATASNGAEASLEPAPAYSLVPSPPGPPTVPLPDPAHDATQQQQVASGRSSLESSSQDSLLNPASSSASTSSESGDHSLAAGPPRSARHVDHIFPGHSLSSVADEDEGTDDDHHAAAAAAVARAAAAACTATSSNSNSPSVASLALQQTPSRLSQSSASSGSISSSGGGRGNNNSNNASRSSVIDDAASSSGSSLGSTALARRRRRSLRSSTSTTNTPASASVSAGSPRSGNLQLPTATTASSASSLVGNGTRPRSGSDSTERGSRSSLRRLAAAARERTSSRSSLTSSPNAHNAALPPGVPPVPKSIIRSPSRASTERSSSTSRPSARFSLASVGHALKSKSKSRSRPPPDSRAGSGSTSSLGIELGNGRAGSPARTRKASPSRAPGARDQSRGRRTGLKALRQALSLHEPPSSASTSDTTARRSGTPTDDDDDEADDGRTWREFPAGTYTYPISMSVPSSLPPSITADFGSVFYQLKATVKRSGALATNLSTDVDVHLVTAPSEDDTEEAESIVVDRMWETQLRYHIALSGKTFSIGGIAPLAIQLNPLAKVKLYRITCQLEQKVIYYGSDHKMTRHEPSKTFELIKIENLDARAHLLPIESTAEDAVQSHLLAKYFVDPDSQSEDRTAACFDPNGPWHLDLALQLPDEASHINFTTSHERSRISIQHTLKIMLRLSRGDDEYLDSRGNRKLWDVIVETQVVLLSPYCARNLLPSYSAQPPAVPASLMARSETPSGNSRSRSRSRLRHALTGGTRSSSVPRGGVPPASVHDQQTFARLIAGQENAEGEMPPTYQQVAAEEDAHAETHDVRTTNVLLEEEPEPDHAEDELAR